MTGKRVDQITYLQAVRKLMYIAVTCRPDLSYTVSTLARFSANPVQEHWAGVMRVLNYLKNTVNLVMTYPSTRGEHVITQYSDADFAGDTDSRCSTSGGLIKVNNSTVNWWSTPQRSVSTSTLQSEYVSFAKAAKATVWIARIVEDIMRIAPIDNIPCYIDNQPYKPAGSGYLQGDPE